MKVDRVAPRHSWQWFLWLVSTAGAEVARYVRRKAK
jgi:hypothetical protein